MAEDAGDCVGMFGAVMSHLHRIRMGAEGEESEPARSWRGARQLDENARRESRPPYRRETHKNTGAFADGPTKAAISRPQNAPAEFPAQARQPVKSESPATVLLLERLRVASICHFPVFLPECLSPGACLARSCGARRPILRLARNATAAVSIISHRQVCRNRRGLAWDPRAAAGCTVDCSSSAGGSGSAASRRSEAPARRLLPSGGLQREEIGLCWLKLRFPNWPRDTNFGHQIDRLAHWLRRVQLAEDVFMLAITPPTPPRFPNSRAE